MNFTIWKPALRTGLTTRSPCMPSHTAPRAARSVQLCCHGSQLWAQRGYHEHIRVILLPSPSVPSQCLMRLTQLVLDSRRLVEAAGTLVMFFRSKSGSMLWVSTRVLSGVAGCKPAPAANYSIIGPQFQGLRENNYQSQPSRKSHTKYTR